MSEDCGLFDLDRKPCGHTTDTECSCPAPTTEKPNRTAQYHRRVAKRIGQGIHPLGEPLRLHPAAPRDLDSEEAKRSTAPGPRCGSCRFRTQVHVGNKRVPKCRLPSIVGGRTTYPRDTANSDTDVAAWWPGCTDYQLDPQRRGRK